MTEPRSWWEQPEVAFARLELQDQQIPYKAWWSELTKPEQYATRKTLYQPGTIVKIPTFTAFGGSDGTFGVAVVASCNWLGLVQLYFVNRFVTEDEPVGLVSPDDVVEVWWGGDGLFISEIFEVVGTVDPYDFDDWPAPIGTLPRGETDGTWLTCFKTRRRSAVTERMDESDSRRKLTLFIASSTAVWRSYARTASATDRDSSGSSSASRWRYFTTTGPQFQASFDYIPHRAGSYIAGDTGDEISGAVASQQYPGVYWMIRDNGPGDRARLYAVKIDPATGLLANLDGYSTKEFEVQGATNLDWEALSIDSSGRLYVFDSGSYWDGAVQSRSSGLIYRIPEPNPYSATSASVQKTYPYTFPNGENFRNVEAVFNVGDVFFLIAKEDPHRVYSLPRYLSENGNSLWALGELSDEIGNISGAEFSTDLSRFGITTTPDKAYFWDLTGENFTPPSNSATQSRAIVQSIINNPPTSHYYYRQTDTWAADGIYAVQTAGITDPLRLQQGMQTEGLAFAVNGNQEAMMVSEYGGHTMFVPATGTYNYYERPGINSINVDGTIPGTEDRLIPRGSWWYYDDDGSPMTDWNQNLTPANRIMETGTGLFGYPKAPGSEVQTELAEPTASHVTDYFAQTFTIDDPDEIWGLEFDMTYDDAAVMYLNGIEVWRDNMPTGAPSPSTLALQWRDDNLVFQTEIVQLEADLVRSLLVAGQNTLAVEVHQNRVDSSDVFFDMELRTSAPRPVLGLEADIGSVGGNVEVSLEWDHDTPTPVAYQIWERPMAAAGPQADPVLIGTSTSMDYVHTFPQANMKLSEFMVVPVGSGGGQQVIPGAVVQTAEVANVAAAHVASAPQEIADLLPTAGTAIAVVNDFSTANEIGEVVDDSGWSLPIFGVQPIPLRLDEFGLVGMLTAIASAACVSGACAAAGATLGTVFFAAAVSAVGVCLVACPFPNDLVAAHQIDQTRTIPGIDVSTDEGAATLRALEMQLLLDDEIRRLADELAQNDPNNGVEDDPDYRWSPEQIGTWIRNATQVCEEVSLRAQAEYAAGAAFQGGDVFSLVGTYISDTFTTGADGVLRFVKDAETILMHPCQAFPIYTPGAIRRPTSAAQLSDKPWSNPADTSWWMNHTSSHVRTAILESENNNVRAPWNTTEPRRETVAEVPAGGRDELVPALLTYRPSGQNPLGSRTWYTTIARNPDYRTQCLQSGQTCDEYPFYSTEESSERASLFTVPSTENSAQGTDISSFYDKCGVIQKNAAGESAAFMVVPMSLFGLQVDTNFPGPPLPSAFSCEEMQR